MPHFIGLFNHYLGYYTQLFSRNLENTLNNIPLCYCIIYLYVFFKSNAPNMAGEVRTKHIRIEKYSILVLAWFVRTQARLEAQQTSEAAKGDALTAREKMHLKIAFY